MFNPSRYRMLAPADDMSGGGGAPEVDATQGLDTPAADAPATTELAAPTTMLEAVSRSLARDEQGRFTANQAQPEGAVTPGATPAVTPAVAAKQPDAIIPPKDELTAMPEGLGAKAQERFQRLANTVAEVTTERDALTQQVNYVKEAFQQHGVSQEQFQQALGYIGAFNRGDLRGALQQLDAQRHHIAMALGEQLPGVDVLAGFPDLRQKVDSLQISQEDALELARMRSSSATQLQQRQSQEQQQSQQRETQQQFQAGQQAVDAFCRRMKASDMDYDAIEARLLPEVANILQGVPPNRWGTVVEATYRTMKSAASAFRRPAAPGDNSTLRATGAANTKVAPSSMQEAMWGRRLTA